MTLSQSSERPKLIQGRVPHEYDEIEVNPLYRDPEAGCGCGENCTRSPGDPCPIAAMPVFEVLFPGFDGSTDKYDHLVKWIKAPNRDVVVKYLWYHHQNCMLNARILNTDMVGCGFDDGLDLVLDQNGEVWVGEIGETRASGLTEYTKKMFAVKALNYSLATVIRYHDPRPIDREEWKHLRGNSYERELLIPKLDDAALVEEAESCMRQCSRHDSSRPASCYDDAMMINYLPLLIERLRAKTPMTAKKGGDDGEG